MATETTIKIILVGQSPGPLTTVASMEFAGGSKNREFRDVLKQSAQV